MISPLLVAEALCDCRCRQCDGFIGAGEEVFRLEEDGPYLCGSCLREELRR
jgi:hypothetical protein